MTNGLKTVLAGVGVGLAIFGLITTVRMTRSKRRVKVEERLVDEDARARMEAEGGALQPVPTHIH